MAVQAIRANAHAHEHKRVCVLMQMSATARTNQIQQVPPAPNEHQMHHRQAVSSPQAPGNDGNTGGGADAGTHQHTRVCMLLMHMSATARTVRIQQLPLWQVTRHAGAVSSVTHHLERPLMMATQAVAPVSMQISTRMYDVCDVEAQVQGALSATAHLDTTAATQCECWCHRHERPAMMAMQAVAPMPAPTSTRDCRPYRTERHRASPPLRWTALSLITAVSTFVQVCSGRIGFETVDMAQVQ